MAVVHPTQIMEAALELRSARADLLATNVVNADTPGYHASDINFGQTLDKMMADGLQNARASSKAVVQENVRYEGNDVDRDQELSKAYDNSLDYVATLKLYGDSVGRIKTAIASS